MSEEVRKEIEDLTRIVEKNDLAKAFLSGLKSGLDINKVTECAEEKEEKA